MSACLLYGGNSKRDEIFALHVISAHRELRSITLQCQSDQEIDFQSRAQPAPWTNDIHLDGSAQDGGHFSIRRSRYRYVNRNTRNGMIDRLFVVLPVVDKHRACPAEAGCARDLPHTPFSSAGEREKRL